MPTSRRAQAASGNACTTTGQNPNHIVLKTTDSNMFGGDSGYTYTLTPQPSGKTNVDVVIVREGKNLKGRVLSGVLGTVGKSSLGKAFTNSVKAIEARS